MILFRIMLISIVTCIFIPIRLGFVLAPFSLKFSSPDYKKIFSSSFLSYLGLHLIINMCHIHVVSCPPPRQSYPSSSSVLPHVDHFTNSCHHKSCGSTSVLSLLLMLRSKNICRDEFLDLPK